MHGLSGDAYETWHNSDAKFSWPDLIANDHDFDADDVYVVGYDTSVFRDRGTIEDAAERLHRQLLDQHLLDYKRVYFVAHSMGGLIVKRILNKLNTPENAPILHRVRAVLLISTPSQGASLAEIGSWISMNSQLKDLRPADFNAFLQALENDWVTMLLEREHAHADYPQVFCAYEILATHGIRIVSRVYATTRCDNVPYPMPYNHLRIVKPPDAQTDPYPWAKARFQEADKLTAAASR